MRVGILVFDRFTDIDFFLPWDLLNRVPRVGFPHSWKVEIVGAGPEHHSATGLPVRPTAGLNATASLDAIFITSGPAARDLCRDDQFLSRLHFDPQHQWLAALDSGALILAGKGLLKGKKAATYPTSRQTLSSFGVESVEAPLVEEGRIATAARCLSGAALCAWLIGKLAGGEIAGKVIDSVAPLTPGQSETKLS